jgi:hypothetical protein
MTTTKKFSEKNFKKTRSINPVLKTGDLVHICVNNGDYGYGLITGNDYGADHMEFYYLVWCPVDNRVERFFHHELTYVS